MEIIDDILYDKARDRKIPISIYIPKNKTSQVVLFNPGYQKQIDLIQNNVVFKNKKYQYLFDYFATKNCVTISIQHDVLGDNNGLEVIDKSLPQYEVREHLYKRGVENILFVISQLKKTKPELNFDKLIMAGHSNGGDIAQYFVNIDF
ncbi:MAG: hypothetical protein KBC27_00390 [Rickettsiales bacterium]|nr:hypothetical protein [Rickettsiales bacterium]